MSNSLVQQPSQDNPIERSDFDRNVNYGNVFKDMLLDSLRNNPTAVQLAETQERQKMAIAMASQKITATQIIPNILDRIESLKKKIADLEYQIKEQKEKISQMEDSEAKDLAILSLTKLMSTLDNVEDTYLKYLDKMSIQDTVKGAKQGASTKVSIHSPFSHPSIQLPPRKAQTESNVVDAGQVDKSEPAEIHINLSSELDDIF